MAEINNGEKIFETPWGNVIINVDTACVVIKLSSGFDSALLLYMIAKTAREVNPSIRIRPITVRRMNTSGLDCWDRVDNYKNAVGVIQWVKSVFPEIDISDSIRFDAEHWWNCDPDSEFMGVHHTYIVGQQMLNRYIIDQETKAGNLSGHTYKFINYSGVTKNPDFELSGFNPEVSRNKKVEAGHSIAMGDIDAPTDSVSVIYKDETRHGTLSIDPFRNGDKRVTFHLADQLGILDTLLSISRSCEGSRELSNNWTEECHHCWWCYERTWAHETFNNSQDSEQEKYKSVKYFNDMRKIG